MEGKGGKEEEVSGVRWDEIRSVVERDGTGLGLGRGRGRWSRMGWDGRVCGRTGRDWTRSDADGVGLRAGRRRGVGGGTRCKNEGIRLDVPWMGWARGGRTERMQLDGGWDRIGRDGVCETKEE